MYSTETEIHDQAYQFFRQEAPEFLRIIETGLLSLRNDLSTNNIHSLMRAAHSIKGGAASLSFEAIKAIAHNLEDVFRALYRYEGEIDNDIEELLLQAYDCLRVPLLEQIQTGRHDEQSAIANAEPIFEVLGMYFGNMDDDVELPTAAELGVDIVQIVFEGDVQQGILRLQDVLANPENVPVEGEIRAQVEVFSGIGELLNLSGFKAIAAATLQALEQHPDDPISVGNVAVANFAAARAEVLAGDRAQGGQPSPALIAMTNLTPDQDSTGSLSDSEEPDNWFSSLEEELEDLHKLNQADPELDSNSELDTTWDLELDSYVFSADLEGLEEEVTLISKLEDVYQEENSQDAEVLIEQNLADLNANFSDNLNDLIGQLEQPIESPEQPELEFDIYAQPLDVQPPHQLEELFEDLNVAFDLVEIDTEIDFATGLPQEISQAEALFSESQIITPEANRALKAKTPENTIPYISETVRVDLARLERLNNFSSELVTQENASVLQNQQLQTKILRIQKQFKGFENLSKGLQSWLDKAQRSQVKAQNSSFSSVTMSRNPLNSALANPTSPLADLADFDALQMDSYSRLHSIVQEALEEIAQMDEVVRDMSVIMQLKQQTQRRKQQVLKQVRYDLLWSRMLPLGDILGNLPRMIREMSNKYDKQVNLKLLGTGTLVDKSVLEKLYDPFVHLVRNAFDHGTESAQERVELGKPATASIEIRAYYRGNQTYIEIKDDGRGIDIAAVKSKAIAVGLLAPEQADHVTKESVYQFLFAPSFSTATAVSELSGRGMGLSTVQEQVRGLKGSIEIKSELGQGTTFIIKLPLTLSVANLLVFSIQDRLMAIAINTLLGILTIDINDIEIIQGREFFRFEDRLISLYPTSIFADGYPLPKKSIDGLNIDSLLEENQTTLLLLSNGDEIAALQIDRVLNEQELAVKPFGKAIAPPPYLYGCTVLGDGTLVPVIDSSALLLIDPSQVPPKPTQSAFDGNALEATPKLLDRPTVLIVDDSMTSRQALYLTLTKFGYQVLQAGDGREALEVVSRSPKIQAVVCDVEMPNMNGFEFLTTCRKDSRHQDLPVIMLTSRSGKKHRGVAQVLGASGYLTKPYLEQELLKTIQEVIPK
ncbi:MAG: hybrid sensor histidine kinase/response regulator [Pseudanabaena sp.]|nr:MAG: hybrid sensor histidine kinase/response regulator [Pseudanabaena sp.]